MSFQPIHILVVLAIIFYDGTCVAQVIWDRSHIDLIRDQEYEAQATMEDAIENLRKAADDALNQTPYSVTHKEILPPSNDKHDYLSFSRYWWPDPSTPDGLPYIRKDGIVNRELIANGDRVRLGDFCQNVQTLSLAGYILKEPRYTKHAILMVRTWFLEKSTRMNPNLNFGQGVPGRASGRGPGLIDTRGFILVLDAVELFDDENWSTKDRLNLQTWFEEYLKWMQSSPIGKHEKRSKNNHGSWYLAQLARYAIFVKQEALAEQALQQAEDRIAMQFDRNGNQEEELKRTRSLHYSLFNISALSRVARVGDRLGRDLWEFVPPEGCSLRYALDELLPYLVGKEEWKHPQIEEFSLSPSSHMTLRLFGRQLNENSYCEAVESIKMRHSEHDFARLVIGDRKRR